MGTERKLFPFMFNSVDFNKNQIVHFSNLPALAVFKQKYSVKDFSDSVLNLCTVLNWQTKMSS